MGQGSGGSDRGRDRERERGMNDLGRTEGAKRGIGSGERERERGVQSRRDGEKNMP